MLVNVNVIYYVHVCEQARWARSAGNSAIENLCIIITKINSGISKENRLTLCVCVCLRPPPPPPPPANTHTHKVVPSTCRTELFFFFLITSPPPPSPRPQPPPLHTSLPWHWTRVYSIFLQRQTNKLLWVCFEVSWSLSSAVKFRVSTPPSFREVVWRLTDGTNHHGVTLWEFGELSSLSSFCFYFCPSFFFPLFFPFFYSYAVFLAVCNVIVDFS